MKALKKLGFIFDVKVNVNKESTTCATIENANYNILIRMGKEGGFVTPTPDCLKVEPWELKEYYENATVGVEQPLTNPVELDANVVKDLAKFGKELKDSNQGYIQIKEGKLIVSHGFWLLIKYVPVSIDLEINVKFLELANSFKIKSITSYDEGIVAECDNGYGFFIPKHKAWTSNFLGRFSKHEYKTVWCKKEALKAMKEATANLPKNTLPVVALSDKCDVMNLVSKHVTFDHGIDARKAFDAKLIQKVLRFHKDKYVEVSVGKKELEYITLSSEGVYSLLMPHWFSDDMVQNPVPYNIKAIKKINTYSAYSEMVSISEVAGGFQVGSNVAVGKGIVIRYGEGLPQVPEKDCYVDVTGLIDNNFSSEYTEIENYIELGDLVGNPLPNAPELFKKYLKVMEKGSSSPYTQYLQAKNGVLSYCTKFFLAIEDIQNYDTFNIPRAFMDQCMVHGLESVVVTEKGLLGYCKNNVTVFHSHMDVKFPNAEDIWKDVPTDECTEPPVKEEVLKKVSSIISEDGKIYVCSHTVRFVNHDKIVVLAKV